MTIKPIEYRTIDKSTWGKGPWQSEPDKISWTDEDSGLPCLIVRGPAGSLCGYVGVEPTHRLHGEGYDNLSVNVHGGLTYASGCQHGDQSHSVCHVPVPGATDDIWWFGFDCAHSGDTMPLTESLMTLPGWMYGTYRDVEYVRTEVINLAKQIGAMK